ncbi:MAG: hypothetical protein FJ255_10730 [Phycisphaerae bacterium]|nr:hypothetical protein [Phycisphaerae bacterium]
MAALRLRPTLRTLAPLGIAASLGGCGYTAHDEYYASREGSFAAAPGDGSMIAVAPLESLLIPPTMTASAGRTDARE